MSDKIVRAIALNGNVRIFVAKTTNMVAHAQKIHGTLPTTTAAMGRVMSMTSVMGSSLKDEREKLIVEIRGDGDLKYILANADNKGFVRALVSNPYAQKVKDTVAKLDVGGIIGNGTLSVRQEFEGNTIFNSQVPLQTGEIGEDFAFYFHQSEQIPSAVSVGVLVNEDMSVASAGVILIQVLPSAIESDIQAIEHVLSGLKPVSEIMLEMEAEEVAKSLFNDVEILQVTDTQYFCGCNRTQMRDALKTLNTNDLSEMIKEDHGAELECHYCHTKYNFSESDLESLIAEKQKN